MIALEIQHFPLLLLDLGGAGRTSGDFAYMFDGFRAANRTALAEKARWVLVATTEAMPTAIERRLIVDESNTFSRAEHQICAGSVLVIPNGFVRGVITLFSWMIPNISPLSAAPTTDAAVELAADRVRKLGFQYPTERAAQAAKWFRRDESIALANVRGLAAGGGSGGR